MSEQPTSKPIEALDALVLILYLEAWSERAVPSLEVDRVSRLAAAAKSLRDVEGYQSPILTLFATMPSVDMTKAKSHLKLVFSAD